MIENLETLETDLIETRIRNLDQVYFFTEDETNRKLILLAIDDLKLELIKRGKYDQSI